MKSEHGLRRKSMAIILIYVLFSVSGLLLLKIGTSKAFELSISEGNFSLTVSGVLVIGMCLYLLSFVTSLIAMKNMDLSVFYPISAGLAYVFVCLLSYVVLRENISRNQLIGMGFILVGVIMMNLKKQ